MGHHLNAAGQFQSDKYPELAPDKIVLSFNDPHAVKALAVLACSYHDVDRELADDIAERLQRLGESIKA